MKNDPMSRFITAPSTRPALTVYVAAIMLAWAFAAGYVRGDVALILLGVVTVLIIVGDMHREIRIVHGLVNSQHDALVERVDQLMGALTDAGATVPRNDTGSDSQ